MPVLLALPAAPMEGLYMSPTHDQHKQPGSSETPGVISEAGRQMKLSA